PRERESGRPAGRSGRRCGALVPPLESEDPVAGPANVPRGRIPGNGRGRAFPISRVRPRPPRPRVNTVLRRPDPPGERWQAAPPRPRAHSVLRPPDPPGERWQVPPRQRFSRVHPAANPRRAFSGTPVAFPRAPPNEPGAPGECDDATECLSCVGGRAGADGVP